MGCGCKDKAKAKPAATVTVELAGGTKIKGKTQAAAEAFVASHPGSKII